MKREMEAAQSALRDLIDANGPDFPSNKPFETYEALIGAKVSARASRLVLTTLLAKGPEKAASEAPGELSGYFQRNCFLRKSAADELAALYAALYSEANRKDWKERGEDGFREFCAGTWPVLWDGEAEWRAGGGSLSCWADAEAAVRVKDPELARKTVAPMLKDNPFLSANKIREEFEKAIAGELDDCLEEYVTGDRYYQPVMEDFPRHCEYFFKDICEKLGLAKEAFQCEASESDFEPDW